MDNDFFKKPSETVKNRKRKNDCVLAAQRGQSSGTTHKEKESSGGEALRSRLDRLVM